MRGIERRERSRPTRLFEGLAGLFEVGRSIDTEGNSVNDGHVDAHAVLQGAELLEALALLEG